MLENKLELSMRVNKISALILLWFRMHWRWVLMFN